VAAGDDQHVERRLRVDVVEHDELLVFVDDGGWNLARDDSAEEAGGHHGILGLEGWRLKG
jgi:hypothetical protein